MMPETESPAPPLKERARGLVARFQSAAGDEALATHFDDPSPKALRDQDAARNALLTFIDEQIDALSSSKARVAELETALAAWAENAERRPLGDADINLLDTLQPPTEEPGNAEASEKKKREDAAWRAMWWDNPAPGSQEPRE